MELPLTPLEFARRARKLYAEREAVIDGDLRLTYEQFFDRCDRWSSALVALGVKPGDRVAYIAPNTHAMLESYYAVPQIGAICVPLNYRLTPNDFVYLINHSGSQVVCAHSDFLDAVESVRSELPNVKAFVALEGHKDGWLDYETLLAKASPSFNPVNIAESDLISINYTSGTTSRPKGVMITHRNAYMNVLGTLVHISMSPRDRYLWTVPMFHANGWTFVWIVTAVGGTHVCLRKVEPTRVFELIKSEIVSMLCAAPSVLITLVTRLRPSVTFKAEPSASILKKPPARGTMALPRGMSDLRTVPDSTWYFSTAVSRGLLASRASLVRPSSLKSAVKASLVGAKTV